MTVSGTVTLTDGTPAAGVRVLAAGATSTGATTDAEGRYSLSIASGAYRFAIYSDRTVDLWYGGGETRESGTLIQVSGQLHLDPVVKPAGEVVVTYSGTDRVTNIESVSPPWTGLFYTYERGDHQVRFWANSEKPFVIGMRAETPLGVQLWTGDKYDHRHATPVQVDGGETVTVHITFPELARITGRTVSSAGFPIRTPVRAQVREDGAWVPVSIGLPVTTPEWGEFSTGVPADTPVSLATEGTGGFARTFLGGTTDPAGATPVTLAPGAEHASGDLVVPGGSPLAGVVKDINDYPVGGIAVAAFRGKTDELLGTAVTDTDGHYSIPGIGSGTETGPLTVRYTGEHVETVWSGGAPVQAEASTIAPGYGLTQTVVHDGGHRVQPSSAPTIVGSGYIGTWLEVTPGTGASPAPDHTEYWWFCNGYRMQQEGLRLPVAGISTTCDLTVQQVSVVDGFASGAAMSKPVRVKYFTIVDRGYLRPAIAGTRIVPTGLKWTLVPDRITYQWQRDGVPVKGATGATYVPTPADVGKRMSVRLTAYRTDLGVDTTWNSRFSATVRARSVLRATAAGQRGKAVIAYRLSTPGTTRPGGSVTIRSSGAVVKRIAVGSTPQEVHWTYQGLPRGWRTLTVTYSGATLATDTRATVRVYVR